MTTNLLNRVPIPGSFGVSPGTDVSMHISTTGTVAQATITIALNGVNAILLGVFQAGFAGTIVTDGSGGWNLTINPTINFSFGAAQTVAVQCTEQPGSIAFAQMYSFQTKRDLQMTTAVCYFEDGDVLEADVFVHEGQTHRPAVVDSLMLSLRRDGQQIDQIFVDNSGRDMAISGAFKTRLLHPLQIGREMTFQATALIDSHQAPGITSLVQAGTLDWESGAPTLPHPAGTPIGLRPVGQPDTRVAVVVPGVEPSEYGTSAIPTRAQEYEVVDISRSGDALVEPSILVDLDFLNPAQYLQTMEGDPRYVGGGNRLLVGIDDTSEWFLQETDELAVTFGARTLLEGPATNLLANTLLTTNPFVLAAHDQTIRADAELSALTSGAQQVLYAVEGSIIYDGTDRVIRIQSPKVGITAGQPVLCSVLARTQLRDQSVTLDTFTMRVRFYNGANADVGSNDFNFDIFAFESDRFSVMEALVAAGSVPVTATQASFDLVIGSWEGCDLMNLWLAAPMIEHAAFTTSRVVGQTSVTRQEDQMTIPQKGNINQRSGRITTVYAPQYEGSPPVNVCVFDTRTSGTLLSGYLLRQRTDGKFELTATDDLGVTTVALSAQPVVMVAGKPVEVSAQWGPTMLTVEVDHVVVAQSLGSFSHPGIVPADLTIGRKIDGSEPLFGELHSFRSYGI